jgi:hypothetical protein
MMFVVRLCVVSVVLDRGVYIRVVIAVRKRSVGQWLWGMLMMEIAVTGLILVVVAGVIARLVLLVI